MLARRFEAAPIRTATLARGGSRPTQRAAGSWLCGSQFPERASCIGSDTSMLAPATTSTAVPVRLKRLVRTRGIAADDATLPARHRTRAGSLRKTGSLAQHLHASRRAVRAHCHKIPNLSCTSRSSCGVDDGRRVSDGRVGLLRGRVGPARAHRSMLLVCDPHLLCATPRDHRIGALPGTCPK